MPERYVGTLGVARRALRRDRVLVSVWTLVLVGVCYASAAATTGLYPSVADRLNAARTIDASPAIVALYGPILDQRSLGELAMTKMTVLYAVFVAMLFLVVVRRHTRGEEEAGHAELLGSTAIGRDALLGAAVAEGAALAVAVGVLAALADVAGGLPLRGSLAFGATWTGIGLVATGLTAAACQLSASARTCAAIAATGLGVLFLLRAVGDTSVGWLSWLSPFGWSTQLRAWSGPRWWVLVLYLLLAALLVVIAQLLRARRDLGSGLIAARPGPAMGSPRLADAVVLAWRVHATALASWTAGVTVMGVVLGAVAPNIGSMLDSPTARSMMERLGGVGALQDTLLAAELSVMAVVVTCFAVSVIAHGGVDERDGRTEQVLATATSRSRTFLATVSVAVVGSTWLLVVFGVAAALGFRSASGGGAFGPIVGGALAQVPAVWAVLALAMLAFALRSAWAFLGWVFVSAFLVLGQLGELLRLPRWVIDLSPYVHVPRMPAEPYAVAPTLWLTAIAAALLALAWVGYRARDVG